MASITEQQPVKRSGSRSTDSLAEVKEHGEPEAFLSPAEEDHIAATKRRQEMYSKLRPYILFGVAAVILGWWISATVLKATRHRWYSHNHYLSLYPHIWFQDRSNFVCLGIYSVSKSSSRIR